MLVKTGPKKFYGAYSPIGGKAAAVVAGFAKGVNFNGSTYIASSPASTALTTTNGRKYLVSFWFRMAAPPSGYVILFSNVADTSLSIQRDGSGTIYLNAKDAAFENVGSFVLGANLITDTNWHHIIYTVDMPSAGYQKIVLDGVVLTTYSFGQTSANNIDFTAASTNTIGARGGSLFITGDMAELYVAHNQSLPLETPSNVQKFRSVSGHPVDLGVAGATPTGTAPTMYFSVRSGGVAADFKTNRGTGGLTWQDGTAGGAGAGTLGLASVDP
jgi:hypothetical protein